MTLFQLVTFDSPVKLTQDGEAKWETTKKKLLNSKSLVQNFLLDTVDGLRIGIALSKEQGQSYFEELVDRDLG